MAFQVVENTVLAEIPDFDVVINASWEHLEIIKYKGLAFDKNKTSKNNHY